MNVTISGGSGLVGLKVAGAALAGKLSWRAAYGLAPSLDHFLRRRRRPEAAA